MGPWEIRIVLPETVQFSICFTLPVIYLTLALLAKWPTELSVHPGDLREFFFVLMGFFLAFLLVCSMSDVLHGAQWGIHWPSLMHPRSVHNVCVDAVVQVVSGLSSKVHPVHVHGHTHKQGTRMCSRLYRCATKKQGRRKCIIPGRREVLPLGPWADLSKNNSSGTLSQQVSCVNREFKDICRCMAAEINLLRSRCGGKWPQCIIFYVYGKFPVSTAEKLKLWGVALRSKLGQVQSDQSKTNSEAGRFTHDCSYLPE